MDLRMDEMSESRLALGVNPQLAHKIRVLAKMQAEEEEPIKVITAFRNWHDQQRLWQQGRDGEGNIINEAIVVTYAPPGHSWHELGLAVDCCPIVLLAVKGWDPRNPMWKRLGENGESLGLTWGGRWRDHLGHPNPDLPHFQLTGKFGVSPNDEVRQLFLEAGAMQVWKEAGLFDSENGSVQRDTVVS
jgi:peptidoglycan LD-endopeptidase CwlK